MAAHGSAPPPPQPPTGDPLGDLQEHLRAYSKAVADTIWELQQMKQPDPARVDALADALAGMADRLDGPGGLVDGLPDYPRDPAKVKARLGELRAEHDALEPALLGVLADVERQQARLQEGVVAAVAPLLGAAGADKGGGVPAR